MSFIFEAEISFEIRFQLISGLNWGVTKLRIVRFHKNTHLLPPILISNYYTTKGNKKFQPYTWLA